MSGFNKNMFSYILTLCLFCVFCASAIGVVTLGAGVYKNIADKMENNFSTRTAAGYITQKARQADSENAVFLRETDNVETIVFTTQTEEYFFENVVFFKDGYLQEVTVLKGDDVLLSAGQKVVALKDFKTEKVKENLYKVTVTDKNDFKEEIIFSLVSVKN